MKLRAFRLAILHLSVGFIFALGAAADSFGVPPKTPEIRTLYCGVMCVAAVAEYYKVRDPLPHIVRPEFMTRPDGSSMLDVKRAATTLGLYGLPVEHMSMGVLRHMSSPVVLQVRSSLDSVDYDHFIVCFAASDGKLLVLNPLESVKWVSEFEVLSTWSGRGIVISQVPINILRMFAQSTLFPASAIVLCVFLVCLLGNRVRSLLEQFERASGKPLALNGSLRGYLLQALVVAFSIVVIAFIFNVVSPIGFIRGASAIAAIQDRHFAEFLKNYRREDVAHSMETDVCLIDARLEADFNFGHIERAINIPPDTTIDEINNRLDTVAKDKPIIVYCQSAGCPFSKIVARRLLSLGFEDVGIYSKGWVDWENES